MTYAAKVDRHGKFWIITVDGVGMTQARNLGEVDAMTRDLIACAVDSTGDVEVSYTYAPKIRAVVDQVESKRHLAANARAMADEATEAAVLALTRDGLSVRDAAALLGVSPSWVSVLARRAA